MLHLWLLNNVYLFLFKSKVVNLGILAQKSDFCLKLEEGLVNNKCKLNYKIFYQVFQLIMLLHMKIIE